MPALPWLQNITGRSKPTKATGEDEINYYVLSLLPPSLQQFLLSAIHYILLSGPPHEWSRARVCLLYRKGDKTDPANYRPICLIQTLVKLAAAWQCEQLTALTQQHRLIHPCQHGGLKNHRCGDHIYDVVSRMLRSKGRLYHLYIDFNKAFNSVPLHALWTTLRGYGLPEALISSIQRRYDNATDQPLINGSTTEGHPQLRGVRQGCPLSPLLFILYLNLMFFHLDGKIEWGLEKSIHAFIDDILFRARSVEDIKTVYEAFDGPARMLGLDMNLSKTELHAVRGVGHTIVRSCHGGTISTRDQNSNPHQVYKYLGVYFYTFDHSTQVYDCMRAEINAFYARLAPLELTASELIMLTNKQLLPTVAYRLLAGPVPDKQLYALQQLIWANISSYGKLPRLLSPKDRYGPRAEGGLCITPLLHFMRSQIYNYGLRYLNSDGPSQSNESVRLALTAPATNWLQESFVDSVHALGGRCHGFGPWNPCPVKTLCPGEEIHVEFNSGWFSGSVLTYDETRASALIRFYVDSTEFHVTDRHTFSLHPTSYGPAAPSVRLHLTLAPPLLSLPLPLPPHPFPYSSQCVDSNAFGYVFHYTGRLDPLQVSDLSAWSCDSILDALSSPDSDSWLWVYLDGSWDNPLAGSAAVLCWPDGTIVVLAIPCPYLGSKDAEFRAFVQSVRYLQSIGFTGSVFFCIHNSQVVGCVDHFLSGSPFPPSSSSAQGTWQSLIANLLALATFNVGAGWLKSHVGFHGNEIADSFAKYVSYAMAVADSHKQPPARHTITFNGNPSISKFGGAARLRLVEKHDHTGIDKRLSFDWSRNYSWFSSFATKWVLGVTGIQGSSPMWDLSDRRCNVCGSTHPLDAISAVAFCPDMAEFRCRLADSWCPNLSPAVHSWLAGNRSKGELRNFARTLVPRSLYDALVPDKSAKRMLTSVLPDRRKKLTSAIKDACSHRRQHPVPDPLPPPLSANTFFDSKGPYSTSDRPAPSRVHLYRPPPPPLPERITPRPSKSKRRAPRPRTTHTKKRKTSPPSAVRRQSAISHFLSAV